MLLEGVDADGAVTLGGRVSGEANVEALHEERFEDLVVHFGRRSALLRALREVGQPDGEGQLEQRVVPQDRPCAAPACCRGREAFRASRVRVPAPGGKPNDEPGYRRDAPDEDGQRNGGVVARRDRHFFRGVGRRRLDDLRGWWNHG